MMRCRKMHSKTLALVRNVKVKCSFEKSEVIDHIAIEKAVKILRKTSISSFASVDNAFVYKKSIDARDKNEIYIVYTIAFSVPDSITVSEK